MTSPLWTLEDVFLPGGSKGPRLNRVSLPINAGTTAILGDSGAGKTSLLNLLVGFERPGSGQVVSHLPHDPQRLPLFWVPPQEGLWPHMRVREHLDVVIPFSIHRESRVEELLRTFDLFELREAFPQTLSQGERARLAIARALATDAGVLVLDEPLTTVDSTRAPIYWDELRAQCREQGTSLVIATHNAETVLRETEQVICLDRGDVAFAGSVRDLYYQPPTREIARFLGPINWIPREEAIRWTGLRTETDIISRPEQIRIEPAEDSMLVVQQARFSGAIEEVRLDDLESHGTRRFFHRPTRPTLSSGMRVAIRVLSLLLVCLGFTGCMDSTAHGRSLSAKSTRNWNLPTEKASLPAPRGISAAPTGELYVLDNAGRVLVYDEDRKLARSWFMPEYSVGKPEKIRRLRDGRLAVADTHYHRVVFFNLEGKFLGTIGRYGNGPSEFIYPVALDEDDAQNLYVCEYGGNDRIQKFDKQGKFLLEIGSYGTGEGQFQRPSGIVWRDHTLYIVDAFNNRVQLYSRKGELLGRFGREGSNVEPFSTPWGITLDQKGRIYVADTGNRRVTELSP